MTTMPLLLEPLADRSLNVSAMALHIATADTNDFLSLAADPRFLALTKAIPCLISDDDTASLASSSLESLQTAGCRIVGGQTIASINNASQIAIPASAQWLAGRWYLSPEIKSPGTQAASRSLELKLLQLVANDAETREIEAVFRQDPVLSYHLLRLVNSIGVGTSRHISSFSQAILILGRQQLKRWLNLMLFSANRNDRRSAMLLAHVAIRARSMELIAECCGMDRPTQEMAFMAGMFSLLGVLFGLPLTEVLAPLNLSAPLEAALLEKKGKIGDFLSALEAADAFDASTLQTRLAALNVSQSDYNFITLEAHLWMLGIIRNPSETGNH